MQSPEKGDDRWEFRVGGTRKLGFAVNPTSRLIHRLYSEITPDFDSMSRIEISNLSGSQPEWNHLDTLANSKLESVRGQTSRSKTDGEQASTQPIAAPTDLEIHCHLSLCPTAKQAFRIPVQLTDLNAGGCAIRYRLPSPLPTEVSSTMLEIEKLSGFDSVQMLARVCWSRKTGHEDYISGLKFRRNLPDRFVTEGARKGLLSRRTWIRESVDVSVIVRQNQPSTKVHATILDTSEGGIQLICPESLSIGSRLLLQLDDGTIALGNTAWTSECKAEFASGIAFINMASGRIFHHSVLKAANCRD